MKKYTLILGTLICICTSVLSSCMPFYQFDDFLDNLPITLPGDDIQPTITKTVYENTKTETITRTKTITSYDSNNTEISTSDSWTYAADKVIDSIAILETRNSYGTGWVYESDGVIATNAHMVNNTDAVSVTLHDGRSFISREFYYDDASDLAVIFIDAVDLPALEIADENSLKIGSPVATLGNGAGHSFAFKAGWISKASVNINVEGTVNYNLFETDVPINGGNSGGPFFNKNGQVVGMVNAKYINVSIEGVTYGINMPVYEKILYSLAHSHKYDRAYLGVGQLSITNEGLVVGFVQNNGPAEQAGLHLYDTIVSLGNNRIHSSTDLIIALSKYSVGETVELTYIHNGQTVKSPCILSVKPE